MELPDELHRLLHTLWTKDVGTRGYDKAKWKLLEAYLYALARAIPEGTPLYVYRC